MIKKTTLALPALLLLVTIGCSKKDRTCSCTETKSGTSTTTAKVTQELFGIPIDLADTSFTNSIYEVRVFDRKMEDVSKSSANSNCINYSEPYYEKTATSVPSTSFAMTIEVVESGDKKYDCKLK